MLKKIFLIIFLILGGFLIAAWISNWQFERLKKSLPEEARLKFEEIKPEQFQEMFNIPKEREKIVLKEFISPDGKLKLVYSSDWMEIKDEKVLERMVSEEMKKKYGFKYLFLAQNFKLESFSQLVINELIIESSKNFDDIIEEMKRINSQGGWTTEILNSEIKDNEFVFAANYQKGDKNFHSKEKIIFLPEENGGKKVFVISFLATTENWQKVENEADEIIDSAQLVN